MRVLSDGLGLHAGSGALAEWELPIPALGMLTACGRAFIDANQLAFLPLPTKDSVLLLDKDGNLYRDRDENLIYLTA